MESIKFAVCPSVRDASPPKLLNGFDWGFAQGQMSISDTASSILVVIAAEVAEEPKMWFS